ncbi:MAG: hypothetical protein NT031_17015 [Planctomycetota bacterium]|nr:hypothetical protein [Planctomycetota bacterium]
MTEVVVFIRGGVFQGAVAGSPDVMLTVVDYDDEASGDRRGDPKPVPCDPALLAKVRSGDC